MDLIKFSEGARLLGPQRTRSESRSVPSLFVAALTVRLRPFAPVDELHGGLEGGVALTHPLVFGQAEKIEEHALQVRHRGFTDTDLRNGGGFDQRDTDLLPERLREIRRGHPASGAPTENDDVANQR